MTSDAVLAQLETAKDGIEAAAAGIEQVVEPDDVAVALFELAEVKRLAARAYEVIEKHYLSLCTDQKDRRREVRGVGLVEVKKATKYRAWQNADLMRVVVARALDERRLDGNTGEFEREADAVARVLAECARPDWRLTPLRARGIDVSEFCEVVVDGYSVKLPPAVVPALGEGEAAA